MWILFFVLAASCSLAASRKYIKIFLPSDVSLVAELAVTDEEKRIGLMFRERINSDQAMLFVFEKEGIFPFWMKNVKFPIDIIWLDKEKRIIHIESRVPPCEKQPCPSYVSSKPAMYVLEVKAGSAEKNKLRIGDRIDFILPELPDRKN